MTDTNNGWPDKPGVPMNPEKDGWHWVRLTENNMPFPLKWTNDWTGSRDYCWAIMGSGEPEDVAKNFCYLGPCLTPDQATALQARVAELEGALQRIVSAGGLFAEPASGQHAREIARAALEGGGVMGWQPIETAPRDGTAVLVYDENLTYEIAYRHRAEWRYGPKGYSCKPTHWMPLPAPPEDRQP